MTTAEIIVKIAPYLSSLFAVVISYLGYRETKRKTQHDELSDLYEKVSTDNNRLRKENARLQKEIDDLRQQVEALQNAKH